VLASQEPEPAAPPLTRAGRLRLGAGLAVSALSLAGVVWWIAGQDAPTVPTGAGALGLLLAALLVYAVATAARGWRWDVILRRAGVRHRRADAFGLVVVGYMGNTVLPARGGELLRIFLLSERSNARRREVLGAIIPERLLDAAALVVAFSVLTLSGVAGAPTGRVPAVLAAAALLGALGAALTYARLRRAGRFATFADRVRPIARASKLLVTGTGATLLVVSVAVWALEGAVFWLIGQALDLPVAPLDALFVVVMASLAGLLPAGPGFAGTYDAGVLFALAAIDVEGGTAVSALLLFRFVVFVPVTLAGLALMVVRYGGLGSALRRGRAAAVVTP
jgi:hypothetical protein